MQKKRYRTLISLALLLLIALIGLYGMRATWLASPLKPPSEAGELVVLTLRGPTTTQDIPQAGKAQDDSQTGFEHDLATLFAKELGLPIRFRVMGSHKKLLAALRQGQGHLAAADLVPTSTMGDDIAFGPIYKSIQYQLIYRTADTKPRNFADVGQKKILTIAETPEHDILRDLTGEYPDFALHVLPADTTPDTLLDSVAQGVADFALVDAFAFSVSRRTQPDLAAAFNVGPIRRVAWAFPAQSGGDWRQRLAPFFDKLRADGTIAQLMDRYYGHVNRIQPMDAEAFLESIQLQLPRLRRHFHEAQRITGIDWRILAAIGYQESHWDALATSPTGVRGLMMLTEDTADRMGVKNRLDARESIIGGARYLLRLRDTVPQRIPEPDRTWLALAAYNQGYGHLEDARILTQRMKLNADAWLDVRKAYLRMRDPLTHETLKYGFCRGDEAVLFVEYVRNYADILTRLEKPLENDIRYDLTEDNKTTKGY
ncbi:MAG: membrane-bound lytic murein transglycosylase MltF [Betaproteobacteria bacterium]|nr:membrane-bound lytic murein transglycosylase MltF [Betaproteobacteria bacterium]